MTRRGFTRLPASLAAFQIDGTRTAKAQTRNDSPIALGQRRELFVDHCLIAEMQGGAELRLGAPVDAGVAMRFDRPWEGAFSGYSTVIHDAARGRMLLYYRGVPSSGNDGRDSEVTCVAMSPDGLTFTRPALTTYPLDGAAANNVILAHSSPYSHNFSPFLDANPGAPAAERFKAVAGIHKSGLRGYVSADGIAWKPVREAAILPPPKEFAFDSQNTAFYSAHEKRYVLYFRTWKKVGGTNYRWISRASSVDFRDWSVEGEVDFGSAPPEHLYTNQMSPYFRAPHIYAAICARFFPGKQVLSEEQARTLKVDPKYFKDCSDAVLTTSRGGGPRVDRTFMEAFLRPGNGLQNWVSRSNYPALNLIQTGPAEMSFYVNRNYGQSTAYLGRYTLRLDGLASLHAGYGGGSLTTRPLTFDGSRLELNFATSAAGGVRVEILESDGRPVAGFAGEDTVELAGDETSRAVAWRAGGSDVSRLAGRAVRLRISVRDGDVYALRFLGAG